MRITEDGDAIRIIVNQSWLGTASKCPEQARLQMVGAAESGPSDATATGTGVHAGIEARLRGASYEQAAEIACDTAEIETQHELFRFIQVANIDTMMRHVRNAFAKWELHIWPYLPQPQLLEHYSEAVVGTFEHDGRTVELVLKGTWDMLDENGELWDWKVPKDDSKWEQWKVDRHETQPSAYTLLAGIALAEPVERTFNYCIIQKVGDKPPKILSTRRGPDDWTWLTRKYEGWARLALANIAPWPMVDSDWHCSTKYCPAWGICKGASRG